MSATGGTDRGATPAGEGRGGRPRTATGVVVEFDADVGLGRIRADDGVTIRFHCTQIADGSRHIAAGTPVGFAIAAGRGGRWEAAAVTPA